MSAPAISSRVLGVMWGAPSLGFLGRPIIARRGGAEQCHGRVFSFNETYRMVCFANEPFPSAQEAADRKSVVSGKSVSVRVDLGGRRIIKQKNKTETTKSYIGLHQIIQLLLTKT